MPLIPHQQQQLLLVPHQVLPHLPLIPPCRYGNPTTRVLEEKIAALEGAEDCVVRGRGCCWPAAVMPRLHV